MLNVSVIIPNYNHAKYLARRIDTVLSQTYHDFEVILMDDASTDDSLNVLSRYANDPRVRTLFNAQNGGGTFKQWNKGVRAARGELIWIAESDDFAAPTLLERLVGELERHPECSVAYCRSTNVDQQDTIGGHVLHGFNLPEGRWARDFVNSGPAECADFLMISNTLPNASAVLFRRSIFLQIGGADESMRLCGDWMLWTRMLLAGDVAYVAEPLNYYRKHTGNVRTAVQSKSGRGLLEAMDVVELIERHVRVSRRVSEVSADRFTHSWLACLVTGRTTLSQNREIRHRFDARGLQPGRRLLKVTMQRLADVIRKGRLRAWIFELFPRHLRGAIELLKERCKASAR